jgi:hypothetical protein
LRALPRVLRPATRRDASPPLFDRERCFRCLFIEIALAKRGTRKKNSNIAQKFVSDRATARFQALSPDFCFSSGAAGSRETVISQTKARYDPPSLFQKPDFALALEILPNKYTSASLVGDKNLVR